MEDLKLGEKTEKDIPYCCVLGLKKDLTGPEVHPHSPTQDSSVSDEEHSKGVCVMELD